MSDLIERSARDIAESVRSKKLKASEVAEAFCQRVQALDSKLHALLAFDADAVIAEAKKIDESGATGRLAGVPIVAKDNLQVLGHKLTCGSKILGDYTSPYDATAIARLRAEGALIIGKSNMDEFAMGSSCEYSAFGPTFNPWDLERVPGGSSGGSAAAVAASFAPISLGSDTGGSIRQPAAFTGTVGFKPTYGRVSRYGLVAFGSSLDQIGPFARSIGDAALVTEIMGGCDPNDATSLPDASPKLVDALGTGSLKGKKFGLIRSHLGKGCEEGVREAVLKTCKQVEQAGGEIIDIEMPNTAYSVQVYYILATSEASSNLARFDGVRYGARESEDGLLNMYMQSRGKGFGKEVKRRIMLGTYALSAGYQDAYYKRALKVRNLIADEFAATFEKVDYIIGPTTPDTAFKLGANMTDPLAMYLCDIYTISANLSGVPALSLPAGVDNLGLPIGVQLQARHGADADLIGIAHEMEKLIGFDAKPALA